MDDDGEDSGSAIDPYKACLAFLHQGRKEMKASHLEQADLLFSGALQIAKQMPQEQAGCLVPLTLCCMSEHQKRSGKAAEAGKIHKLATELVDRTSFADQTAGFYDLMSNALIDLKEHRRAIPFCEQAIRLLVDSNYPLEIVLLLRRQGACYNMCGQHEHAVAPLRAALKILRNQPADPMLPSTLIDLGNALRKSSPAEAERFYLESAEIHVAKMQLESATPAWMNLGILCSEQGRYEESLAYYDKVRKVREQSPHTPRDRMGRLLNNMANVHRRMKSFPEALKLVGRAIEMLDGEDPRTMASAYGTRGEILHNAGRDQEAIEWLRKSYALRRSLSSPDLSAMIEILEHEIECLKRMGSSELAAAEERLAQAKAAKAEAQGSTVDLGTLSTEGKGAVLVELTFGSRPGGRYAVRDAETAAEQLSETLRYNDAGFYAGRTVIPESTTLLFYGEDGETLFQSIEQFLLDHLIFAGATVTIRQGTSARETVIPQPVN